MRVDFHVQPFNKVAGVAWGWFKITLCEKTVFLKMKTMLVLFFDRKGVVHKEFVP